MEEAGEGRGTRRDPFRLVICAAAAVAVALGLLAAAGGVPAPEASGEPLVQVVRSAKQFPNRVEAGRVSLGYPDGMWVILEPEPDETNVLGKLLTVTQALVGDDDFSHGFAVAECEGLSFEDVRELAETAQEQAPARAEMLEGKAAESESSAQMYGGLASHYRNVVYDTPEPVVMNGRRGIVWGMVVPFEGGRAVTRINFIEVDGSTVGIVYCGFYQHEYDADPAFWDDILASLEVR